MSFNNSSAWLSRVSIIIPSLNPRESLISVIEALEARGARDIILVNDGSDEEHRTYFERADLHESVTVLTHEVNRGKGAALKTAFAYVTGNRQDCEGGVTVDDDFQHDPDDVVACVEKMLTDGQFVLGSRDFASANVPPKSLYGNRLTALLFRVFFGMKITDTQTGLRAIPRNVLEPLLNVEGERYEYETKMLLFLRDAHIDYTEVKIQTVYIENNKASHFRPLVDTARIFWILFGQLFKYGLSSVGCLVFETVLQTLLHDFWKLTFNAASPFISAFLKELCDFLPARILSSVLNYFLNRTFVFKEQKRSARSAGRYAILWSVQAIATALTTTAFNAMLGGTSGIFYSLVTFTVKCLFFAASYTIQKKWVFSED